MNKFEWHARNHQDALDGMLLLTLEERGAYNTVLDLIYSRAGPVPDEARWLAGWMGCSVKKWNSLRASLVVEGKLFTLSLNGQDCLMNRRAADEIASAESRATLAAENGAKGGRKFAENLGKVSKTEANPSENNVDGEAALRGSVDLKTRTETEQKIHTHSACASDDELRRQNAEAAEAGGDALASPAVAPGIANLAPLRAMLHGEPPCDWREDVLPAIGAAAAWHRQRDGPGSMRSWTTAVRIALQNRDQRLAGLPAPRVIDLDARRPDPPPSPKRLAHERNMAAAYRGAEIAIARRRGSRPDGDSG